MTNPPSLIFYWVSSPFPNWREMVMQINEMFLREYTETKLARLHREASIERQTRLNNQRSKDERALVVRLPWLRVLRKYF